LRKILIIVFLILNGYSCLAQGHFNDHKNNYILSILSKRYSNTYGVSLFPHGLTNNNGICLNLISCENQTNNGINIELIGNGILDFINLDNDYSNNKFQTRITSVYNGISISPLGMNSYGKVNGLIINGICCTQTQINGIGVSLLSTNITNLKGVNISCISKIGVMKGLQIGIAAGSIESKGVSLGIVTGSGNGNGMIIGVYNNCQKHKGIMLGLINVVNGSLYPFIYFNFDDN
jgi:hypothetical protein